MYTLAVCLCCKKLVKGLLSLFRTGTIITTFGCVPKTAIKKTNTKIKSSVARHSKEWELYVTEKPQFGGVFLVLKGK
jgi:hypothetical protein